MKKKSKIQIAEEYCEKIDKKEGYISNNSFIRMDKKRGGKVLTWDNDKCGELWRHDEAGEWIAKVSMCGEQRGLRKYHNAIRINSKGAVRAYFNVDAIKQDSQLAASALMIMSQQIDGITKSYMYLKEAVAVRKVLNLQ